MDARYAIERKIASGGMATVYLGRLTQGHVSAPPRPVAIKICHPHLLDGGSREHRTQAILDEARIASRIHHPNVVAVLDVVVQDDSVMIVMEYVEGVTVAGLVRAAARAARVDASVPVDVALRITHDALAGLHAAHELEDEGRNLGVVHRDVSPQNILVGVDGSSKLADFGVFKGAQRLAPSTETGDLKGKLGYVAPEVYRGEPVTRRADIYAVGVVLWEMLAGRRLFDDTTHAALMHRVLAGRIPPLGTVREDVPYELDAVLARALALDPSDRFATAEELSHALSRVPVALAPAHVVAREVHAAMETEEPPRESAPFRAPTDDVAIGPIEDVLTPSDYVTPVRSSRPGRRPSRVSFVVAGAALIAVVIAGAALVRSPSLLSDGSSTPSSRPAHGVAVIEAKHGPVVTNERAPASAPSASSAPSAPRRPRPAPPSSPSPIAPSAQPFYDPKEL